MIEQEPAKELLARYEALKTSRYNWEQLWQEIRELVRPNASDFAATRTKGETRNNRVYDDTPTHALGIMASGIHAFLTNPAARWFEITTTSREMDRDPFVGGWLETVSDQIYDSMRLPDAQYSQMMHELYHELGAFGTGVMFSYVDSGRVKFRTYPLAECYIDENDQGVVDTVFRKCEWTTRQALQYFGDQSPQKVRDEKDQNKIWEFLYAVYPRTDRNMDGITSKSMPYASVWLLCDTKEIITESGFKVFPYHVPRWEKMAGEVYGRSPAMNCIQMIRVLNASVKVMLQSSQMQAAPPLLVEDENVVGGIKLQPFSLIYTAPGAENAVRPLQTGANLAVNLDLIKRLQEQIMRCFYNDLFQMPDTGGRDRVTATEVMENRDDRLRQLAPIFGRLETELLNPQIKRIYLALRDQRGLPEAPSQMMQTELDINYLSPAAQAQRGVKALNMQRFIADLVPLAQIKPDVFNVINFDKAIQDYAIMRNVSRQSIKSEDEINAEKEAQAQQQQMMQMAQMAPQISGAIKDLADAGEKAPNIGAAFGL